MSTPKFIERPNVVQTSLYGYDRTKKVQDKFQLNNLRGNPIVVLRAEKHPHGKFAKKFERNNTGPVYPSYAHFHHQYSCSKPNNQNSPSFADTGHERSQSFRRPINSPKHLSTEDLSALRIFDKLAVPRSLSACTSPTSIHSPHISSDITLLELKDGITKSLKALINFSDSPTASDTSASVSEANTVENGRSFVLNTPRSHTVTPPVADSCPHSSTESSSSMIASGRTRCESDSELDECAGTQSESQEKIHTCDDEVQCDIFRGGCCVDEEKERKAVLKWYDELIQWRHDVLTKKKFGPPRCHPPPLTVTLIGASRAQRANPFHRNGNIHPFTMDQMEYARRRIEERKAQVLTPFDLPLPAPHEFMANAKCMEPHLFIEYCYQLTAAAYIDTGLNPPNRRPPIPPPIEPRPDQTCKESVCSSASEFSSDGEYSDDSDATKDERLRLKLERQARRSRRFRQICIRRQLDEIKEEDNWLGTNFP